MESMRSSATGSQLLLKAAALKNDSGTAWYRKRKWVLVLFPVALAVVVLAVILPVYFLVIKKNGGGSSGPDGGSSLRVRYRCSHTQLSSSLIVLFMIR